MNATSPGVAAEWGIPWFNTTNLGWSLGSFMFLFAVAITPLILAPMSEMFGRNIIYQVTTFLYVVSVPSNNRNTLFFLPQILSHSHGAQLAARFLQGMTSSVGNSMVGGTVADLYPASSRGNIMNGLALAVFIGQSCGAAIYGWVGMYCGYPWIYGVQAIAGAGSVVLNLAVLRETRADVLLSRRAKKMTKDTGIPHTTGAERQDIRALISAGAGRPLKFLFTEPIVSAICLWIGFAWGCIFLSASSTLLVFGQYGWNSGVTGSSEFAILVGGILGYLSNYHQEYLYARAAARSSKGRAEPEARLYWAATGGFLFPLCLFVYAWTGRPEYHWAIPAVFLSLSMCGVYIMYLGVL